MTQTIRDAANVGLDLRRSMFGVETTNAQVNAGDPLMGKLQEIVTEACFGQIWSRDQLSLRDRSLVTVAMLTALGREPELRTHIRGAISNGVTPNEIREVMIHSYLYAGLPAAFGGANAANSVLDDTEKEQLS